MMNQPARSHAILSILVLLLTVGIAPAAPPAAQAASNPPARTWQGIPGVERTAGGRVFVSWFSGGPKEPDLQNTVYLCFSDDQGETFSDLQAMAGPLDGARAFDPTLWIDPAGRLWYIFNRGNNERAEHAIHARLCDDPDAATPVWSDEFKIDLKSPYSFRMNKPTVLSSGEWILPVTHAVEPVRDWFAGTKQLQGVGISTDQGRTWTLHGALEAPHWALECMTVELRDGRLWMLIRAGGGFLWESFSADRGQTWSAAAASTIPSPGSRFFIRRLASGNLLLVNHYRFQGRSHLTARISTDDGVTWNDGLLLDERANVSYPDGVQDRDGLIWVVYDRDRNGAGEILMARFREEDAIAGEAVSGAVRLKQVVGTLERPPLLAANWDPVRAADEVLARLVNVTDAQVKGAHDANFIMVNGRAMIAYEANDVKPGESADWPYVYLRLSEVDLKSMKVVKDIPFARGMQVFENETLPPGACFVPRIIRKDDSTLRCFFASEEPGKRQSQTWFIDYDLTRQAFENQIHRTKLKTSAGVFDMQPQYFHSDAAAGGFPAKAVDYGLYIFDTFKRIDGKTYVALNNFPGGQNALATLNDRFDTFEVLGHYNRPFELKLTESAVNRLPDGSWMAICRQELGNRNYIFTTSRDGITWAEGEQRPFVAKGTSAKPTFDQFNGIYYLGWQEASQINGVHRSVFNIDISADGRQWQRKYRFETEHSFQYPTFQELDGLIWLTVTQGDTDAGRKERIMFGRLE